MLDGDDVTKTAFTTMQLAELERTLYNAQTTTGMHYSIYVGSLPGGRQSALELHRRLDSPAMGVLVAVDPEQRLMEIVTGSEAQERLDDQSCRLASLTMTSRFAIGDIAAGLRDGVNVLAEHARVPRVLHTDEPE